MKKEYALIVAAGSGSRLKSKIPKQFIELNGKPVLIHTLEAFYQYSPDLVIVVVLPEANFEAWSAIVSRYTATRSVILQKGGETRFQSVRKGLDKIEGDGLVAIHDGVRPLVSVDIIAASFRLAAERKAAVAAVALKESIRSTSPDNKTSRALDRGQFRLIQTPQTFDLGLIKKAYEQAEDPEFTDDASVAERAGHDISLFEGSYRNIKITTPEDLLLAEALLSHNDTV